MNIWQKVVDHELVIAHLGVAKDDATWDEARKAISFKKGSIAEW